MASGGSRVNAGRRRDPNALRRERDKDTGQEWIELPPAGRQGPAPEWPLTAPSARESELWGSHWAKPQAVVWEAHGLEYEVALYVRNLTQAELAGSPASRSTLVKQLMEDLGLTEAGMARNLWRIADKTPGRFLEAASGQQESALPFSLPAVFRQASGVRDG